MGFPVCTARAVGGGDLVPCLPGLGVTSLGCGPRVRLTWEGSWGTGLRLKLPVRLFGEARPRLVVWWTCPRSGAGVGRTDDPSRAWAAPALGPDAGGAPWAPGGEGVRSRRTGGLGPGGGDLPREMGGHALLSECSESGLGDARGKDFGSIILWSVWGKMSPLLIPNKKCYVPGTV